MTALTFRDGNVERTRAESRRWIPVALLVAALAGSAGCNRVSETLGLSSKPATSSAVEKTDPASAADSSATNSAAGGPASTAARSRAGVKGTTKKRQTGASVTPIPVSFDTAPVAGAPLLPRDASADAGSALTSRADAGAASAFAGMDGRSPVYSRNDPDVTPARLLTTQKGGPTFTDRASDVNTMELVISKQGRVEQVKLLTPTKRMTDMLLLSGAKTWKFLPATKNGQPVRYRTQFSWETVP